MIKSFLTQEMVIQGEPALDDYLRSDQTDFNQLSQEALADMTKDFIDMALTMRRLNVPLSLGSNLTKTASFNGIVTGIDYAQRNRLEIKVTALTGIVVFKIEGTNDDTIYNDVFSYDKQGDELSVIAITETGSYSYFVTGFFKKYRLNIISIGTTVTYTANLWENIFTILHRDKTRSKIYGSLKAIEGDIWSGKHKYYQDLYESALTNSRWYYDSNEDDEITGHEGDNESLSQNIVFRL